MNKVKKKKIVRIDMTSLNVSEEEMDDDFKFLGGRGLTARLIVDEINPRTHALSKGNKLIFAPGLLSSAEIPCSSRLSIGSKSLLTGGIKESNVGGPMSQKLARLGIGAIVIEGQPAEGFYVVRIDSKGKVHFKAKDFGLKGNDETAQQLLDMYGKNASVLSIGPAGEMLLPTATIAATDQDGISARHAGRGGLGAIMGSKGIKAIVVEEKIDKGKVEPADKDLLKECVKEFSEMVVKINKGNTRYGTTSLINFINKSHGLPTRNFSRGVFDGAEKISGERIAELIKERGGKTGHGCYRGCIIRCGHVFNDKDGNHVTSKLDYETVGMLGSNLEIDDIDMIAKLDRLCGDIGIDTIELGATMGVLMEGGHLSLSFGRGEEVIDLLEETKRGTPLGRLIGSGCDVVGKVFGCRRVPVVKGQALPSYDPRALQGMGVTFATSPMGADHTAGPVFPGMGKLDPMRPEGQAEFSKKVQIYCAILDNFGLCLYTSPSPKTMEFITKAIQALYGETISGDELDEIGSRILKTECEFNEMAGLKTKGDDLPLFFREENLPSTQSSFSVSLSEL